jgi:hypothetical protein
MVDLSSSLSTRLPEGTQMKHPQKLTCLVVSTPLKNMKVSWDNQIPNIWKHNPNIPNHQPVNISMTNTQNTLRNSHEVGPCFDLPRNGMR